MTKKYRLKISQLGLPAGTEFMQDDNSKEDTYVRLPNKAIEDNLDILELVIEWWQPASGGKYWYVDTGMRATEDYNGEYWSDKQRLEVGNCFQTKEQSKEAVRRIKDTLMNYHEELATNKEDA